VFALSSLQQGVIMNVLRAWPAARIVIYCIALNLMGRGLCAQDPLVRWTFDEPAGGTTNALDTGAPPATTGMLGSTATRTADTPGGAPGFALDLSAPGAGTSIVDGGNPIEVDTLTQLTFTTWVKVTSPTDYNEGGSANVRLLAKQAGGAFDGFTWNLNAPALATRSNNAFRTGLFIGGQGGFSNAFSTEDILDRGGDWLFMAVTYDGMLTESNTLFYLGDETTPPILLGEPGSMLSGQVNSTNTTNGGAADARFAVGLTDGAPTADTALTGYQDDVRVYDRVLDLAELDAVRLANLSAPMALAGDYNDNGAVDAADYAVWRNNLGTSFALPNETATPGMVTQEDYTAWRANFGSASVPGAAASTAAPEPGTLLLGLLSLVAFVVSRRAKIDALVRISP
jgi:hypothetical protein